MRHRAMTTFSVVILTPVIAYAQLVEPRRVAPGADVTVDKECNAAQPPLILLDGTEVPGTGTSPKWRFKIPAGTAAKTYAVTFRCLTAPVAESGAGSLEVTVPLPSAGEPHVDGVVNVTTGSTEQIPTAALKNVLRIRVRNFNAWRGKNPQTKVHLFLAGAELKNVVVAPTSIGPKDSPETFALRLAPEVDGNDDNTRKTWVQVLQAAKRGDPIEISLGPAGEAPFTSDARIRLDVYPTVLTWGVLVFYGFLAYWIGRLGKGSRMLRDANGAQNPPYSLARHQMAIWTIVVVGAYLYIWLTTGLCAWVSTTALALLGISGVTGLVALTMDDSKRKDAFAARTALQAERDALDRMLNNPGTGLHAQLQAAPPGSAQSTELIASMTAKLTRFNELVGVLSVPAAVPQNSAGWITDLVSDENGVSFHRVQMVVWTLVLVIVFIAAVRVDVLMPMFDNTLLGLMGISSGTYLGFKFPERPA